MHFDPGYLMNCVNDSWEVFKILADHIEKMTRKFVALESHDWQRWITILKCWKKQTRSCVSMGAKWRASSAQSPAYPRNLICKHARRKPEEKTCYLITTPFFSLAILKALQGGWPDQILQINSRQLSATFAKAVEYQKIVNDTTAIATAFESASGPFDIAVATIIRQWKWLKLTASHHTLDCRTQNRDTHGR